MMLDRCQGLSSVRDILELAGDYVDHAKLSFGTPILMRKSVLSKKIELFRDQGVSVYPGGTLAELASASGIFDAYVAWVAAMGFDAIEISDGVIDMDCETRRGEISRASDAGLTVFTEVGKKAPDRDVAVSRLVDQIEADLAAGADRVIIEARESGRGIGIWDDTGQLRTDRLAAIRQELGPRQERVIWEAPRQGQQATLINHLGPNVNLGNVKPRDVLGLEALRCGLRFETFRCPVPKSRGGNEGA
jgi:phosphosulfolactate synthase